MLKLEIVDAQLHELGPFLDWSGAEVATRRSILTEWTLATTEAVGVDAVVLFPIEDEGWAEQMASESPDRFCWVPMILNVEAPDTEERIASACSRAGVKGIRLLLGHPETEPKRLEEGGFESAFAAVEQCGLPLFAFISGYTELAGPVARAHPNLTIIIDHLGLRQAPTQVPDPVTRLAELRDLAKFPNVHVKLCGAPSFSSEPFPFADIWDPLRQLVDAFGPERLMWASDIGRFRGRIGLSHRITNAEFAAGEYPGKHTYAESLGLYRDTTLLTDDERALILGGTVRRVLGWPRPQ